ncbi:SH3 domain-containing protein [Streptomyces kanamyceticus]|uniref:SH3 domain-containing protein n=1 Tax=Streptomyces kanamyceticus TaxID=1967 RepID=A0A5J6GFP6_STRKN|nr:SH3 domain-containing protein [Streptomyces kanamyceticus]QEU93767.1 SH3 domain-containing protein [Streptomyces kanamyceticus]
MMGTKLRTLIVSGALVAGVGMTGAAVASAAPLPGPDGVGSSRNSAPSGHERSAYSSGGKAKRGDVASVTVDGLRVRTGPGTSRRILGQLYEGERVTLIGARQDKRGQIWHRVVLKRHSAGGLPRGFKGWVTAAYLY